jgi:hypothetical protein
MADHSDNEETKTSEIMGEVLGEEEEPLLKKKVKKPRSEAQLAAFERAAEKRRANLDRQREAKELKAAEKILRDKMTRESKPTSQPKKAKIPPVVVYESESDAEPEIIYKKRPKKPQPKKKKIVYVSDSSSDDSSDESVVVQRKPHVYRPVSQHAQAQHNNPFF